MSTHQHERWQLRPSAKGGVYCAACGDHVDAPVTYGVRDKGRDTNLVAVHPHYDSAKQTVDAHPDWYELVCTAYPSDPKQRWYEV
jgi:hypothetical protein